ncbi:hypothetical protein [Amycolatopsis sacchari]|uniref:Uncharacterized protein n=1 Tax=Amycolatopsis sacchari TaxID=115433 RepID=A0A1I3TQA1_9PSEU|nr:hypothetical protein [Amycolatopsis sacchari]SFJ73408.1 hypothetical protein SAMN05421835_10828 [Amycolatopsis sacchari]
MSVTEGRDVRGQVLVCGASAPELPEVDGLTVHRVGERPGKDVVDPLLDDGQLIVVGTDADLAAVALRLLRKEKLATTRVGFVPADPASEVAALWGLPTDPARALKVALHGDADPVPLIRDDNGGVLVGRGTFGAIRGVAYCDDDVALRGTARSIEVTPDTEGGPGLVVRVVKGLVFKRPMTLAGRAFQLGCVPTRPTSDGVPFPRAITRWTWYRHTEDLRLVRGLG